MIKTEIISINGIEYLHTFSTLGYMIERDGVRYSDAIDPYGSDREYIEVESEAVEATELDYIEALERLGVYAYA